MILRRDLAALGVERGMTLTVNASMSSIGWVVGGPSIVVRAVLGVIEDNGTLAMPSATPYCSDPAMWPDIEAPDTWLGEVRENLPVFDPQTTPTAMGAIAESFRTWPGTMRSNHPLESVCARGPLSSEITGDHPLAFSEGPGTPFGKLHELDSWILLLGVGFNRCTALHFAETLVQKRRTTKVRFPMLKNGRRVWVEVPNVADDNDTHFTVIGKKFTDTGRATSGSIGEAQSTLFSMRDSVDLAVEYFEDVL
jgi:aminoglycoside 3-N-acetyltransferase